MCPPNLMIRKERVVVEPSISDAQNVLANTSITQMATWQPDGN